MASIELKLQPFLAPNYASVQRPPGTKGDGLSQLPTLHVSELTDEALTGLAEQWLTDLYAKAGKKPNWSFLSNTEGK